MGRANVNWQNAYLDQDNEFVMDRMPYPYLQMKPKDMEELKLKQGDLVEVYNDNGSTQAMVYPTPTAKPKPKQTLMLFAYPRGVQFLIRLRECRAAPSGRPPTPAGRLVG